MAPRRDGTAAAGRRPPGQIHVMLPGDLQVGELGGSCYERELALELYLSFYIAGPG